MNLFSWFAKRKAIKEYLKIVHPYLSKTYGEKRTYSPTQVTNAIEATKTNTQYVVYAYAAFCTREDFDFLSSDSDKTWYDYSSTKNSVLSMATAEAHTISEGTSFASDGGGTHGNSSFE